MEWLRNFKKTGKMKPVPPEGDVQDLPLVRDTGAVHYSRETPKELQCASSFAEAEMINKEAE